MPLEVSMLFLGVETEKGQEGASGGLGTFYLGAGCVLLTLQDILSCVLTTCVLSWMNILQ